MRNFQSIIWPKKRIFPDEGRIINVFAFIHEYATHKNIHSWDERMRRNNMISFKRTKKRNYQHPGEKYFLYGIAGMFVLLLVLMLSAFSGKERLDDQLTETCEMMAASIQSDLSKAIDSYETIGRTSADLGTEILPEIERHMYAASSMNRVLTEIFGEEYSMIDDAQYESFQGILTEFEQLLTTGQSTESAQEHLTDCMKALQTSLSNRFTASGDLLPKTASTGR